MEGFKKEKTAENQLFDVFIKDFFCELDNKQKSTQFRQNLDKEAAFVEKLAEAVGHLRSDLRCASLLSCYKGTQNFKINQILNTAKTRNNSTNRILIGQ
ncbi:hypothetical protein FACS1894162_4830 [Bacteroidia bacterium]|nr:hypothetical protein FACS1894162_4830 [Bacteroidia bacterium]